MGHGLSTHHLRSSGRNRSLDVEQQLQWQQMKQQAQRKMDRIGADICQATGACRQDTSLYLSPPNSAADGAADGAAAIQALQALTLSNTKPQSMKGVRMWCKVLKVYDGDTLTLGFFRHGEATKASCRCLGYDTAEMRDKREDIRAMAVQARDYVASLLLDRVVDVTFFDSDKYGRPLIEITLPTAVQSLQRPIDSVVEQQPGEKLHERMIALGLGRPYTGRGPKPW